MNIWIMNHYATEMFEDKAGRHYWFARELNKKGHNVTVFTASTFLNTNRKIDTGEKLFVEQEDECSRFVFVKTPPWDGNGVSRIKNWVVFYKNLFPVTKKLVRERGKPDVIIASSVHPLTMVAGIKISKRIKVPCICEIRDLWPEAIFSFGKAKEKSLLGKILIKGEHWIYKNADALIFTKEGDTDYLKERKWITEQGGDIDLKKCYYINNGVDLMAYQKSIEEEKIEDPDLIDNSKFNVTYAGTIRPVNNVGKLLDAAKIIKSRGDYSDIQFLIFGDGVQLEELKERANKERIDTVRFKGYINRQYIPYVLSRSAVNVLNYSQNQYNWSRGNSSNKLFEYMASGKPIISTVHMGYSLINKYQCGIELDDDTAESLANAIIEFHDMDKDQYIEIGTNGKTGAKDFDFGVLTDKLLTVIEQVTKYKEKIL